MLSALASAACVPNTRTASRFVIALAMPQGNTSYLKPSSRETEVDVEGATIIAMKTLAERFASERAAHGQTYDALAKLANCTKQALMKIESGATLRPSAYIIEAICENWQINQAWLLRGTLPRERRANQQPPSYFRADIVQGDIVALQIAMRSLVKAMALNIPAAARTFSAHVHEQAEHIGFSIEKKLMGQVLGIAEPGQSEAEAHDPPEPRRGLRGSKKR